MVLSRLILGAALALSGIARAQGEATLASAPKTSALQDFKTEVVNRPEHFAVLKGRTPLQSLRIRLVTEGGEPRLWDLRPAPGAGYQLLIYSAGVAGTSSPTEVFRAVVLNAGRTRVYGDAVYQYRATTGAPIEAAMQPKWAWSADAVLIDDPATGTKSTLRLKP